MAEIKQLYDSKVEEQFNFLLTGFAKLSEAYVESSKKLKLIDEQLKTNEKTTKNLVEAKKQAEKVLKDTINTDNQLIKKEQELEKLKQQQLRTDSQTFKNMVNERKETERLIKEKEKQAKAAKKAEEQAKKEGSAYNQLSKQLNESRQRAKDLGVQYGVNDKRFKSAQKEVKELDNRIKTIDASVGQHQRNVGNYASALGGATNSIYMMTKAAVSFIATPLGVVIGAIALALKSLQTFFTSSEEGQNALNKVTKVFGVIVGNVKDIIADFGEKLFNLFTNPKEALKEFAETFKQNIINRFMGLLELIPNIGRAISHLFKGEFKEAGKVAVDAVAKVGLGVENITDKIKEQAQAFADETKKEIKQAQDLADLQAKLDKEERQLIVDKAKLEAEITKAREKAADEEQFTAQERYAALEEVSKLTESLAKREIEIANQRAYIKEVENSFSKSTKEDLNELEELRAKAFHAEQERAQKQIKILREQERIRKEILAERKADTFAKDILPKTQQFDEVKSKEEIEKQKFDIVQKSIEKQIELGEAYARKQEQLDNEALDRQEKLKQGAAIAFNESIEFANILMDINQQKYERQMMEAETAYKRDMILAGDNEAAKRSAERKYAVEQARIQRAQAQSEKKQALFNVTINTAVAIVKALSQLGPIAGAIASIGILATGVAQGVAISRQPLPPIPAFDKGSKSLPSGHVAIAEKRPELITHKGRTWLQSTPLITDKLKGAEVIGGYDTYKIMQHSKNDHDLMTNYAMAEINKKIGNIKVEVGFNHFGQAYVNLKNGRRTTYANYYKANG